MIGFEGSKSDEALRLTVLPGAYIPAHVSSGQPSTGLLTLMFTL